MKHFHRVILILFLVSGIAGCNYSRLVQAGQATPAAAAGTLTSTPIPATPTITFIPTPTANAFIKSSEFSVVFIGEGKTLDVYSEAGGSQELVGSIDPHAVGITHTGQILAKDDHTWIEVNLAKGGKGWADVRYLTNFVTPQTFCADARLADFVDQLMIVVKNRDGRKFAQLVSPLHGLTIRHEWWNPDVFMGFPQELSDLFESSKAFDWGINDASGAPIQGPFKEQVLPWLDDVNQNYSQHCNTLDQGLAAGGTTGYIQWPFEYTNFNYVAVYRPAATGDELNWRTWAIGIEVIDNQLYLVSLVQYHWEI